MKVKCWVVIEKFFRWGGNQRTDDLDKEYCHSCSGQPPPRENKGQGRTEVPSQITP